MPILTVGLSRSHISHNHLRILVCSFICLHSEGAVGTWSLARGHDTGRMFAVTVTRNLYPFFCFLDPGAWEENYLGT